MAKNPVTEKMQEVRTAEWFNEVMEQRDHIAYHAARAYELRKQAQFHLDEAVRVALEVMREVESMKRPK